MRSSREKSGAVAAFLSLIPGLGQAYQGRRRAALAFAAPVVILLLAILAYVALAGGLTKAGFRLLDPNFAAFAAVVSALTAIWWALAITDAGLAGRPRTVASRVVPVLLVLVLAAVSIIPAVPLSAAWFWQVSVADRGIYVGDPTLVDPTDAPQTSPPSAGPGGSPTPLTSPEPTEEPEPSPSISAGPSPSIDITHLDAQDDGWLNVFLAGTDQGLPNHVGARTDTMVVVSVNNTTRDVYMFSFPRDLQTLPIYNGGTFEGKLNTFAGASKRYPEKFPEPGMPSLAYEVGFLLGVPMDYYASVNTSGFVNLVAAVGSVTVCNERQIDDEGLEFHLTPGIHTLGPEDALSYVRSRHGQGGGDFARAKRQQQVLTALRKEVLKPENLTRLPELIEAMSSVVHTNFPPDQMSQLVDLANNVSDEPTNSWVFKEPQWADFFTRRETGGRQVLTPRIDRIGGLSVAIFGDKSLYFGEYPAAPVEPDASPSPQPGELADCASDNTDN